MSDLTQLLDKAVDDDRDTKSALFAEMYEDLRRLAHARLKKTGHVVLLDTTSLVHESYLRFLGAGDLRTQDRSRFLAYAARVMRSVTRAPLHLNRCASYQHLYHEMVGALDRPESSTAVISRQPFVYLLVRSARHHRIRFESRSTSIVFTSTCCASSTGQDRYFLRTKLSIFERFR